MNALTIAVKKMNSHIANSLKGQQSTEDLIVEYMKLSKLELATMLAEKQKIGTVTVESVCKLIMEDADCAWLTWGDIAKAVSTAMNSQTSDKSIASYASKNPITKGWVIPPRKSIGERNAEMMKLAGM
jgi:hypothetical protein